MTLPDLNQLVTLDALLADASVTGAARRLGLSVAAVSHALARLREQLGDPLLVRAGRGMVLTPRAEALRETVRDAVTYAERVFAPPEVFAPSAMARAFTVSATDYVLAVLGDALERRLAENAPALVLRFLPNAVDDAERLRAGESDLAIGIYGELPPELMTRPLLTDRHVGVARAGHPALKRMTLARFTSHEHIQIAPRGRPGGYVDDVLSSLGHTRRVSRAVPYFEAALLMAAQSDRLLVTSERLAKARADALGLAIFELPLTLEPYTLSMIWHPRVSEDPGHSFLREQLVASADEVAPTRHANARKRLSPKDPTTGQGPRRRGR